MIRSMTGFARSEQQGDWGGLVWELRAVNHRYLDVQLRLPEELRTVETELRGLLSAAVSRGKVEANLRLQGSERGDVELRVDSGRLRQLKKALDVVAAELNAYHEPDPMRVLSWPGVVAERAAEQSPVVEAATAALKQTIAEFNATRDSEGQRIAEHLRERIATMRQLATEVRERAPQVRDAWVERLRARCTDLGVEVEPARLAQEVALAAQRLDVDEEMSRLAGHLDEVEGVLGRDDAVGRRLDFLMQELNREANTLSSKSQDEQMTKAAVEMKVLIEQMREQVQNVE